MSKDLDVRGGYSPDFKDFKSYNQVEPPLRMSWYKFDAKKGSILNPFTQLTHKNLNCVILATKMSRVLYEGAYTGEEKAPDCKSSNGKYPDPGSKYEDNCKECEMSSWQGDTPPECKMAVDALIYDVDMKETGILSFKSTTLKHWWPYYSQIERGMKRPLYSILTSVTCEEEKVAGRPEYSVLKFNKISELNVEQTKDMEKLANDGVPFFLSQGTAYDEVTDDETQASTEIKDEDIAF